MIVCSCNVITDAEIERALLEILGQDKSPLPTPGVVWKHLSKRMRCCGCAPFAVETIYGLMEKLERDGSICPERGRVMRGQLIRLKTRSRPGSRASQFADEALGWAAAE